MLGAQLPLASALPFVALLAAIAVAPLVAPAWWHSNRHKAIVAGLLSLPILWQFGAALGEPGRAVLRANKSRRRKSHIVIFFIFLVANCGGLLTPIGDPPLLLGYLNGVPFAWTLRLWPQWLTATAALLVVFNLWDQAALNREER